jgi:hypothetical protein
MFSFSFQGQEYLVKFFHSNKDDMAVLAADKKIAYKAATSCVISKILPEMVTDEVTGKSHYALEEVSTGVSFCSKKDNFSRSVGRSNALTRALENMDPEGVFFTPKEWSRLQFQAWSMYYSKLATEYAKSTK